MAKGNESQWRRDAGRLVCGAVIVPIAFIVLYPWVYLLLPEHRRTLADLPQELSVLLLVELVIVPLLLLGAYIRHRRRLRS